MEPDEAEFLANRVKKLLPRTNQDQQDAMRSIFEDHDRKAVFDAIEVHASTAKDGFFSIPDLMAIVRKNEASSSPEARMAQALAELAERQAKRDAEASAAEASLAAVAAELDPMSDDELADLKSETVAGLPDWVSARLRDRNPRTSTLLRAAMFEHLRKAVPA